MEHRHLLPDEIDLLVDGEEGFGVAPLTAHAERCSQCRAELERQRRLVGELERLPHFEPSPLFAHRVMSQVQVFEPWHVTALDSVRRFVPRSQPARVLAGATAGLVSLTLTLATLWIGSRLDVAAFFLNVVAQRVRNGFVELGGSLVTSLVGEGAANTLISSGVIGLTLAATGLLLTILLAAVLLRAVATTAHRRRT